MANPVASDDFITLDEDTSATFNVLTNDSPNVTVETMGFAGANFGSVNISSLGDVTYTPIPNFSGSDSFTYTIKDNDGDTDTATVFFTINPVNDGPVARDDTLNGFLDNETRTIFVLTNDFHPDGDTIFVTAFDQPTNGTIVQSGSGQLDYTPNVGFNGQDSFTYTISDSNGATSTATVTIGVIDADTIPVAVDDEAVTAFETPITIPVLANDAPGSGGLTVLSVFLRGNGTVAISPDETEVIYTPNPGFWGHEVIRYTLADLDNDMDFANVLVFVEPPAPDPDRIRIEELDEDTGFVIRGQQDSDRLGESVARAGDINGDGIDDLIVAAPSSSLYGNYGGTTYVIFGKEEPFGELDDGRRVLELNQIGASDGFRIYQGAADLVGGSVSPAGDLNHDGFDDILISAQNDGYGEAYVIFGKSGSFGVGIDLNNLSADQGMLIAGAELGGSGNDSNGGSDHRDALIGDFNGDDIDDIIIGSPGQFFGGGDPDGKAYVIYGSDEGLGTVVGNRRVLDLGSLTQEQGFRLSGGSDSSFSGRDRAGFSVAGAGNVNGDMFDDIIIGTRNNKAFLIFGSDLGFDPEIDLRSIDGDTGVILQGDPNISEAGHSVAGLGDINGDGLDDFAIGARNTLIDGKRYGATYVVFGRNTPFGEVAGEQRILDLPTLTAEDGFIIKGDANYDDAGFVVAGGGDFNGDGLADFIVGAPYGDDGADDGGEAYIIYGTTEGFGVEVGDQRIFDLGSSITPQTGRVIQGDIQERVLGFDVAFAGDLNGDGADDIIIGGPSQEFGIIRDDGPGEAYVIFGTSSNTPPVAVDDEGFGIEDIAERYSIPNLVANDTDAESDFLTITAVFNFTNGTAEIDGNFINFTPDPGFVGIAGYDYTVSDGNGGTDTGRVAITFVSANAAPVAVDDTAMLDEDSGSVSIAVLTNDSDAEGDAFSVTGSTPAANGAVIDTGGGTFSYTPDADFSGTDSFTYTITDSAGGTGTATVTITVNPVNDAPVAMDRTVMLDEDGDITIVPLDDATDVDGDTLTLTIVKGADNGGIGTNPVAGFIAYGPDPDFNGTDTVIYSVSDGNGGTTTATVTFVVSAVNDAPMAGADTVNAVLDTPREYDAATLLANDSDVDGDALSVISVSNAVNGTVALDGTTITFTPASGFTGQASFNYTISDGNGGTDAATVSVTVTEANSPPDADATRAITTLTDTALVFDVIASDPDGDALSYAFDDAANGSVSATGGRVTYTPGAGFTGTDAFTATISDGNGGTATQEITVTVSDLPLSNGYSLFVADGFAGSAGESGTVFGTSLFQDIAVIDAPGTVSLDPSFNRGGDIVRLFGDAADWSIVRVGSSALLSDNDDTFVLLPVGTTGLALVFDDGVRELKFDSTAMAFTIGGQAFGFGTLEPVEAAPDGTPLPTGADPQALGAMFLAADAGASVAGPVSIFGTLGQELVSLLSGTLSLDPSFNRGGDVVAFDEVANDFTATRTGSSILLDGSDTQALVPVGSAGATLTFGDGSDMREVRFDSGAMGFVIGTQLIGFDPVQLAAA